MNLSKLGNNFIMDNNDDEEENIKQLDWKYQNDPYQESGLSISFVNEAFLKKKDLRFSEKQGLPTNIINKSQALYRHANNFTFDRNYCFLIIGNKSGEQMIYDRWSLENDKYIEYDCKSENS